MLTQEDVNLHPKPQVIVIWMHGLGANGKDFLDIIPFLQLPNEFPIRFVFPNAPEQSVTINGGMVMPAWFDILSLERSGQEDTQGILRAEMNIHTLIEKECQQYQLSSKNIILAGFSQGGALALFTALRYPEPLAGVLGLSCYLPMCDLLDESASSANADTEIFLAHGDDDDIVPVFFARKARQWLSQQCYQVQWQRYSMAHTVCPNEIVDISKFLQNIAEPIIN